MKLQSLKNQMESDVAFMNNWIKSNDIKEGDFESVRNYFIIHRAQHNYQMRLNWLNELKLKISYGNK